MKQIIKYIMGVLILSHVIVAYQFSSIYHEKVAIIEEQGNEIDKLLEVNAERNELISTYEVELLKLNNQIIELNLSLSEVKEEDNSPKDINDGQIYEVTFYTAGYESTQKKKGEKGYGITASGTQVKEGRTAAVPKSFEFGTKIYIEGFGERTCEDRGSAITEGHVDIYVDDVQKAIKLGRQKLKVKILN